MKKMILLTAIVLSTTLSYGADKTKAKSTAVVKHEVVGTAKWTGYGVGKSHSGEVQVKKGEVEMKGDELVGGTFIMDMATLKTADSPKLEGHLQSADFFDIGKFPEATYKITKVEAIKAVPPGSPTHKISGMLTIKNKTEPLEMMASITKKDGHYNAVATTEIKDRTKYDIVYNSTQFKTVSALGDKLIEDRIKLDLNVTTK